MLNSLCVEKRGHKIIKTKVLVCGGGTIGHVTPALAILENVDHDLLWLGTDRIDSIVLKSKKIKHINQNLKSGRNFKSAFFHFLALTKAFKIIRDFNPEIVIGTGGYASFPGLIAAKIMNKKIILIEPNAKPGWANKILKKIANKIFCSKKLQNYFGKKAIGVNVPVYKRYKQFKKAEIRKKLNIKENIFVLCVTGGSQGSQKINKMITRSLKGINETFSQIFIFWQCGSGSEEIKKSLDEQKIPYKVNKFTDSLDEWMCASDIVICRAGACTLAEIKALGKKSILIPLKTNDNHQFANAEEHAQEHAAEILSEDASCLSVLKTLKKIHKLQDPQSKGLRSGEKIAKLIFD